MVPVPVASRLFPDISGHVSTGSLLASPVIEETGSHSSRFAKSVGSALGGTLGLIDDEGETDAEADDEGLTDTLGLPDALGDNEGDSDGDGLILTLGLTDGETDGLIDALGLIDGLATAVVAHTNTPFVVPLTIEKVCTQNS